MIGDRQGEFVVCVLAEILRSPYIPATDLGVCSPFKIMTHFLKRYPLPGNQYMDRHATLYFLP